MNQIHFDHEKAAAAWNAVPSALAQMGYSELRENQKPCLNSIFGGKDVFCILATGGGKTALAAIPTLVFDCQTIIFSPLIALMKDQCDSLNRKGIRAGAINSNHSDTENWNVLQAWASGRCKILLVAPERISHPSFQQIIAKSPPDLVVIDEAHTMSKWGASFRPSYVQCGDFVAQTKPKQVIALTATATQEVIDDVTRIMGANHMVVERHYSPRPNLILSSEELSSEYNLFSSVLAWTKKVSGSVIVYCNTIKQVVMLTEYLAKAGESVTFYHGQMTSDTEKDRNQDEFMSGRARIIVATNAFGMGIDKPDIECIIHTSPPGSIEAVSQEIGRAARDGRQAYCHMFATPAGYEMQSYFWTTDCPGPLTIRAVIGYLMRHKDRNDEVQKLIEDIAKEIDDPGAASAINYLTSIGCIERYKPTARVATFCIKDKDPSELGGTRRKIYDAIITQGIPDGKSGSFNPVYKIDLNVIPDVVGVKMPTVQSHIRQLDKDGFVTYVAPYSGKVTRVIRGITDEELFKAAERRETERHKMEAVRSYIKCPDSEKHEFLNNYFYL